ncbi:methylated-DNA--[protein]-cysteine S-methyltransferase [Paracoccaceae bacterium GXU_MW_L88]
MKIEWKDADWFAQKGEVLQAGWIDTEFGDALAVMEGDHIVGLGFAEEKGRKAVEEMLLGQYGEREIKMVDLSDKARLIMSANVPARLATSEKHREVLSGLCDLGASGTPTYAELGEQIGWGKGAGLAIGGALGANRVCWLIPCHRVLKAAPKGDNKPVLGNYRWGPKVKHAMLDYEGLGDHYSQ